MWRYILWIPPVIAYYVVSAYLSKKLNDNRDHLNLFILLFLIQTIPIWPFVAKCSNNLMFDGLLYDILILLCFNITLLCLGVGTHFSTYQWISLVAIIAGMIGFRMG
jgi:hypothetical protein